MSICRKENVIFLSSQSQNILTVDLSAECSYPLYWDFPGGWDGKASAYIQCRRPWFDRWVGKIPWRRKWQPTPVVLPGKSDGRRSLVGYIPWGRKELDTTERLHFHFHYQAVRWFTQMGVGLARSSSFCTLVACNNPQARVWASSPLEGIIEA